MRGDCSRAAVSSRPSPDHVPPTPSTSFRNKCGDGIWTLDSQALSAYVSVLHVRSL